MRKIISLGLAIILIFLLGACVKNDAEESAQTSETVNVSDVVSEKTETAEAAVVTTSPDVTVTAEPEEQSSSAIIAESSNTVSDKEKQAILDELSDELDSALSGTGSLEDLDDSDLNTDNIE